MTDSKGINMQNLENTYVYYMDENYSITMDDSTITYR